MSLKCTICKQAELEREAEYIFQGESLCLEHFERYLNTMLFMTKGKRNENQS